MSSIPKMRTSTALSTPPTELTREQLVASLDTLRESAVGAAIRAGIPSETINTLVSRANAIRDEVATGTGPLSSRLGQLVTEVTQAYGHIIETGQMPSRLPGDKSFPWVPVLLAAAALGGLWWWAREQEELAGDCGCDG